jgi:hypothetical protein
MPDKVEKKVDPKNDAAKSDTTNASANEGEGSRTAARRYNEGVARTMKEGHVDELAKKAKDALEGPEGDELRRAEEEGKGHAADPIRK